jgi:hypothetical protein
VIRRLLGANNGTIRPNGGSPANRKQQWVAGSAFLVEDVDSIGSNFGISLQARRRDLDALRRQKGKPGPLTFRRNPGAQYRARPVRRFAIDEEEIRCSLCALASPTDL